MPSKRGRQFLHGRLAPSLFKSCRLFLVCSNQCCMAVVFHSQLPCCCSNHCSCARLARSRPALTVDGFSHRPSLSMAHKKNTTTTTTKWATTATTTCSWLYVPVISVVIFPFGAYKVVEKNIWTLVHKSVAVGYAVPSASSAGSGLYLLVWYAFIVHFTSICHLGSPQSHQLGFPYFVIFGFLQKLALC